MSKIHIEIELFTEDKQECHCCGKISKKNYLIWLDYLCQHRVTFCFDCIKLLKDVLNKEIK